MDNPENETGSRRESESVKPDLMGLDFPTSDQLMDPFADGELPAATEFPGIKASSSPTKSASAKPAKPAVKGSPAEAGGASKAPAEQETIVLTPSEKETLVVAAKASAKAAGKKTSETPVDGKVKVKPAAADKKNPEPANAKAPAGAAATEEVVEAPMPGRRFLLFTQVPAWLVSMLVHMLVVLALALMTFSVEMKATGIMAVAANGEPDGKSEIEQFDIEDSEPPPSMEDATQDDEPTVELPSQMTSVQPVTLETPMQSTLGISQPMDFSVSNLSSESLIKATKISTASLSGRSSSDVKKQMLKRYGGTDASEAAVQDALDWIRQHQMPNGGWSYEHTRFCRGGQCGDPGERAEAFNAATAMAILPFLGAGQTHKQGKYKDVVAGGLRYLVSSIKLETDGLPRGKLSEAQGNMYSHGLAAIALCEAYAMTEDPELQRPAQAVVNYIVYAQDPRGGGWRYSPKQEGDTSVVGWQLMALKSAYMGHLQVPQDTLRGANKFLDFVATSKGAYYGYDKPSTGKPPATTAIGLLCRMYMGWDKKQPGIIEGAQFLAKTGVDKKDIYYDYYAAQVLRHYGGAEWEKFNSELRDWLVSTQERKGHAKGSWHFPESKSHRGPIEGGRLASTAFATMILEVYYRHMPLYADAAAEDEFSL